MSTPNFEKILEQIEKGLVKVDGRLELAKNIKKQLEEALVTAEGEGRTILKAIVATNLFVIDNVIESLEIVKEKLKAQLNQVVGMLKLAQKQAKAKAKPKQPNN